MLPVDVVLPPKMCPGTIHKLVSHWCQLILCYSIKYVQASIKIHKLVEHWRNSWACCRLMLNTAWAPPTISSIQHCCSLMLNMGTTYKIQHPTFSPLQSFPLLQKAYTKNSWSNVSLYNQLCIHLSQIKGLCCFQIEKIFQLILKR